ncbi:hypothetical protein D3C75_455400 [compost metagenome]
MCGGILTYYKLSEGDIKMNFAKIPDTKKIKRYKDFFPSEEENYSHGEGDGMTPTSAKFIESKYNGGLSQTYYQSNTGRERSVNFDDSGIITTVDRGKYQVLAKEFEFTADGGSYKIGLANGTTVEVSSSGVDMNVVGDVKIKATGNISFEAQTIKLN